MKNLKQCVGIDISKCKFDCCLGFQNEHQEFVAAAHKVFNNDINGYRKFIDWVKSKSNALIPMSIVMEATGIYYENLAYFLNSNTDYAISVILPAKAKYYFKSLSHKTKTDKIDAQKLSQFALERKLKVWEPVSYKFKVIKSLSREYRDNKKLLNQLKNQLHAKMHSFEPSPSIIKRLNHKITLIENHCLEIELDLKNMTFENTFISDKIDKLCSIPGVGFLTAISIIAETNGFALIRNSKQLTSYAGLDVRHNDSGMKTGKSKISKKGNSYIRQALYMPALSASRLNSHLKNFYERVNDRNECKKIG